VIFRVAISLLESSRKLIVLTFDDFQVIIRAARREAKRSG
jgi:hypothetical protein